MATLKTYSRKLEQTLYNLGEHHLEWGKDDEGMTYWIYPNTPKVQQIFTWFKEANEKKWKVGW